MSPVHELIAEAEQHGASFVIDGDRARIRGATLPAALVDELRTRRSEVIDALRLPDSLPDICRKAVEGCPKVSEARLQRFIENGQDTEWCRPAVAAHIAKLMQERLID